MESTTTLEYDVDKEYDEEDQDQDQDQGEEEVKGEMMSQNDMLFMKLMRIYQDDMLFLKMLQIVTGHGVSLRIIDWFTTNYSKTHSVVYPLYSNGELEEERFKVYQNYRLTLKSFKKKRFDPFCRHGRTKLHVPAEWADKVGGLPDNILETTLGQLNFFQWAITRGVIDYIESHLQDIIHDIEKDTGKKDIIEKDTGKKDPHHHPPPPLAKKSSQGFTKTRNVGSGATKRRKNMSVSDSLSIERRAVSLSLPRLSNE
jgi:hypothetical protein